MQGDQKNLTETEKEDRGYKGVHIFLQQGKACIFDVRITDSDAARNREVPPDKIL